MSAARMAFGVLLTKEEDTWVAHCLELDIVATAKTEEEAMKDLIDLIIIQLDYAIAHDNMENFFKPAPGDVWEQFFSCKRRIEKVSEYKAVFSIKKPHPDQIVTTTCSPQELCYA